MRVFLRAGQRLARTVVRNRILIAGFLPALALAVAFWFSLPVVLFAPVWSTVLLDRDGRLLSASIAPDGQWRFPGDGAGYYQPA